MKTMCSLLIGLLLATPAEGRSRAVVRRFMQMTGYPHGRPGYVVDHIIPICAGGPDVVANLQWQKKSDSFVKDRYERALCAALKKEGYILAKRTP